MRGVFWMVCGLWLASAVAGQETQQAFVAAGETGALRAPATVLRERASEATALASAGAGFVVGWSDGSVEVLTAAGEVAARLAGDGEEVLGLTVRDEVVAVRTTAGVHHWNRGASGSAATRVVLAVEAEPLALGRRARAWWDEGAQRIVLEADGRRQSVAWEGEAPTALAVSPTGTVLAAAEESGGLRLFRNGALARDLPGAHAKAIDVIAFSADGRNVATGSEDCTVGIWDVESGKPVSRLVGHLTGVSALAFSAGGRFLATGSWGHAVRLWHLPTRRVTAVWRGHSRPVRAVVLTEDAVVTASSDGTVRSWPRPKDAEVAIVARHARDVNGLAWSPDGAWLASASADATIRLWEVASGRLRATLAGHTGPVTYVRFSPDGRRLASASIDESVRLWDVADPSKDPELVKTYRGHRGRVTSVCFHPKRPLIVTGGADRTARVWDLESGAVRLELRPHDESVKSVAFTPDGEHVLTGSADTATRVWDLATGRLLRTLTAGLPYEHIHGLAFSPDGRWLATGALTGRIRVWDFAKGKIIRTLEGHTGSVESVQFHPAGHLLASTSADGTARLWDPKTGDERARITGHSLTVYQGWFNPEGSLLATCSSDCTVKLWAVPDGRFVRSLPGDSGPLGAVAAAADGQVAFGAADHGVRLWTPGSSKPIITLTGHRGPVRALALHGGRVASASDDGSVLVWDRAGLKRECVLEGTSAQRAVALHPRKAWLASGGTAEVVRLWDLGTQEVVRELTGHLGYVQALAFHPDGTRLASGSEDASVRIWSSETGEELRVFEDFAGPVLAVAFDVKGSRLAVGTADGRVSVFDATSWTRQARWRAHAGGVTSVTFAADGSGLLSAGRDHAVRWWPGSSGARGRAWHGHAGSVTGVALLGGDRFVSVSDDQAARVWRRDAAVPDLVARTFENAEWAVFAAGGKTWRAETRHRLRRRTDPLGPWEPWTFARDVGASELTVAWPSVVEVPAGPVSTEVTIRVRNSGSRSAFGIVAGPGPGLPEGVTVVARRGVGHLPPGAEDRVTVVVARRVSSGAKPTAVPLRITTQGGLVRDGKFPLRTLRPRLEVAAAVLHRDAKGRPSRVDLTVANRGKLDPDEVQVALEFVSGLAATPAAGHGVTLYGIAPGEDAGPLPFAVPSQLSRWVGPLSVRVVMTSPRLPGHRWTSTHELK